MPQSILVTHDGAVLDPDVPFLHADDLAAVRGDGVFETLLVRDGRARNVSRHLDRLQNSARALDLPAPDLDRWRTAITTGQRTWAEKNGRATEGLLRIVYSRGRESAPVGQAAPRERAETGITRESNEATAYLTVGPVPARVASVRTDGTSVITLTRGYSVDLAALAPWQLLGAKTLSYATNMAAQRHATAQGVDDVIYTSSEGQVLESPRSTVIVLNGDTLITPPVEDGVLPGTTQQALFETAEKEGLRTEYRSLRVADLIVADGVWLLSSVTLATRVRELNGYEMPEPARAKDFAALVEKAIED
ncbi:MAG: aminodeoxychorismate lyase [Williamsia herbipolensis]|uniref:aminodeoxychorismate lyase n=1 Tax=Williamsia serinedens TaxID=391736 RepID=UPI001A065456|nr:aminodeoxychorismate lyase [Williamsia serinedens]MBE7160611.1 aminodeoxychorismate lyase [Williamsia herbipolensis]